MDAQLLKAAVLGVSAPDARFNLDSFGTFSKELSDRPAERAVLLAAGINALKDDSERLRPNAEFARFHSQPPRRPLKSSDDGKDFVALPAEVADAALCALGSYVKERDVHYFADHIDAFFFYNHPIRLYCNSPSFLVSSFLHKFAQLKVCFSGETSRRFVRLIGQIRALQLNRRLVAAVGGREAKLSAICEHSLLTAERIARHFYSLDEAPHHFPIEILEAKMPKKGRQMFLPDYWLLELAKCCGSAKARDVLCALPHYPLESEMMRSLDSLAVNLTQEDSLRIEELIDQTQTYVLNSGFDTIKKSFKPFFLYANALVAKTRANGKLRRQALVEAKSFALNVDSDVPGSLMYLPLEEWSSIFQTTPRQILGAIKDVDARRTLLREARVSYFVFGAPEEWENELIQPRDESLVGEYFQFIVEILRVKYVGAKLARKIVDVYLESGETRKSSFTPSLFLFVSMFEPYPWRKEFAREFVFFLTRDDLKEEKRSDSDDAPYTDKSRFGKIFYPWIPDDIRDAAYPQGKNCERVPLLLKPDLSDDEDKSMKIIRNYLAARASNLKG